MLTAEQKAAKKAERNEKRAANAVAIKAKGEGAIVASLDNMMLHVDEQIEGLSEGQEAQAAELKNIRADLEKTTNEFKSRPGAPVTGADMKKFKISKFLTGYAKGKRSLEEFDRPGEGGEELEVLVASEQAYAKAIPGYKNGTTKKDVFSALNNTSGGAGLPFELKKEIIEAARSTSALLGMVNIEQLEGYGGFSVPVEIPRSGAAKGIPLGSTSVQQGGALTLTSTGLGLANFTPRKQMMGLGFQNDFLKQGGDFVEAWVRSMAVRDFRNYLERQIISGRGQEFSEPTGLLNRTDFSVFTPSTAIGTNGRGLELRDFSDMEISMSEVDRLTDSHKFLTRPGVIRGVKNQYLTLATGGQPYPAFPALAAASLKGLGELLKFDIKYTTNVPFMKQGTTTTASTLLFADFKDVWLAQWGPMEFMMTDVATVAGVSAFESDMTFMRFIQLYDMNCVRPDAFMKLAGLTTAN